MRIIAAGVVLLVAAGTAAASSGPPRAVLVGVTPLRAAASGIVLADGAVWVTGGGEALGFPPGIWKIDRTTGRVRGRILRGTSSEGLLHAYGSLWTQDNTRLLRADPASGRIVARIGPIRGDGLAVGAGSVWDGRTRVDPRTNRVAAIVPGRFSANDSTFAFGSLWIGGQVIKRVDPRTNRVVRRIFHAAATPNTRLASGAGALWYAAGDPARVVRLDPPTGRITARQLPLSGTPNGIAFARGAVRILLNDERRPGLLLETVDPATLRTLGPAVRVPSDTSGTAPLVVGSSLWLAGTTDGVARIALR